MPVTLLVILAEDMSRLIDDWLKSEKSMSFHE